jgi:hypothetical protein
MRPLTILPSVSSNISAWYWSEITLASSPDSLSAEGGSQQRPARKSVDDPANRRHESENQPRQDLVQHGPPFQPPGRPGDQPEEQELRLLPV